MNIIIPVNMVPDLVEELVIDETGAALDTTWMRLKINEFDDHAIEQGILLKERHGGQVIVLAPDVEGVDDVLYTAAAKGADRLVKLEGDFAAGLNNHALACLFVSVIEDLEPNLILTGVQAHNDLDGQLGALLAEYLEWPYVGYVAGVSLTDEEALVHKEYPGGVSADMGVVLPAVLGIQAADEPPRYIAFSRVRQAMQQATIEARPVAVPALHGGPRIERLVPPQVGERAEMIAGDVEAVATRLIEILHELGIR